MCSLIAVLFSSFAAFASDCHFVRPFANRIELSLNGVKSSLVGWTHFSKQEHQQAEALLYQAVLEAQNKSCAAGATALRQNPRAIAGKICKNAKQGRFKDLQGRPAHDNNFQKLGIEASPAEMFYPEKTQTGFILPCPARPAPSRPTRSKVRR